MQPQNKINDLWNNAPYQENQLHSTVFDLMQVAVKIQTKQTDRCQEVAQMYW